MLKSCRQGNSHNLDISVTPTRKIKFNTCDGGLGRKIFVGGKQSLATERRNHKAFVSFCCFFVSIITKQENMATYCKLT